MSRKGPEGYINLVKFAKELGSSSSTIIRLSQTIDPPLDTVGTFIAESEVGRVKEMLPKHFEEVREQARKFNRPDRMRR